MTLNLSNKLTCKTVQQQELPLLGLRQLLHLPTLGTCEIAVSHSVKEGRRVIMESRGLMIAV